MRYTVKQLSELTGLTPRTLRYYDSIGLLSPARDGDNDYRLYGPAEVDRLQQILLYREMGVPLDEISRLLDDPAFDRRAALAEHLERLRDQRRRVDALINTVANTLAELKGETEMKDREKFEGMKDRILKENEARYGKETREKYGDEVVDASAVKIRGMSQEEWDQMQAEAAAYQAALVRAMERDDPAGEDAIEACRIHKDWLLHTWKAEWFTPEAHMGLVEMYDQDERFRAYYDKVAPGCAAFFAKAIRAYYNKREEG